jgi:hypothetical protein
MKAMSAVLSLSFAATSLIGQSPTIIDSVVSNGGKPVTIHVRRDATALSLEQLAAGADLVLEGRLTHPRSYLSEDKHIYTDYQIRPGRVLVDRNSFFTRATPGAPTTLVVTLYGGEVVVNGISATLVDHSYVKRPSEGRYLMFLRNKPDRPNEFEVAGSSAGLFAIDANNTTRSMRRQFQRGDLSDLSDTPLETVFQRITAAGKR